MTTPNQGLEKRCTVCRKLKELSEFYLRTNGTPHGKCKSCYKARVNKARAANRAHYRKVCNEWTTAFKAKVREAVFAAYGGAECACCGENERKFLTLDHINNDGAKHRMKIAGKRTASGWTTYVHLYRQGFPAGYQILCMNCNFGKRMNHGVCPHKTRRND